MGNGSAEKKVYLPSDKIDKNGLNCQVFTCPSSNSFALQLQLFVKQFILSPTPQHSQEHPKKRHSGTITCPLHQIEYRVPRMSPHSPRHSRGSIVGTVGHFRVMSVLRGLARRRFGLVTNTCVLYDCICMKRPEQANICKTESRLVVYYQAAGGRMEVIANGYVFSFFSFFVFY